MGRMIAQLVCHSLLPEAAADIKGTHLEALFLFLRDNADMVRNVGRKKVITSCMSSPIHPVSLVWIPSCFRVARVTHGTAG